MTEAESWAGQGPPLGTGPTEHLDPVPQARLKCHSVPMNRPGRTQPRWFKLHTAVLRLSASQR